MKNSKHELFKNNSRKEFHRVPLISSRFSIASLLTYGIPLLLCISLILTGVIQIYLSFFEQQIQTRQILQKQSQLAASQINSYLAEFQYQLNYLARVPGFIDFPLATQKSLLLAITRQNSAIEFIATYRSSGQKLLSVNPYQLDESSALTNTGSIENILRKKNNYHSPVSIDPDSQAPIMVLSVPIRDQNDNIKGSLISRVNLKYLWYIISKADLGETGYAYIVDRKNRSISKSKLMINSLEFSGLPYEKLEEILSKTSIEESSEYNGLYGQDVTGWMSKVPSMGWKLIVELPTKEAYAPIVKMTSIMLAVVLFSMISALVVSIFMVKKIVMPITNLTKAIINIEQQQQLNEKVISPSLNEINQLSNSFNQMLDRLEFSQQALHEQDDLLTTTLSSITDGVIVTDIDLNIVLMNAASESLTGWKLRHAQGKKLDTVFTLVDQNDNKISIDSILSFLDFKPNMVLKTARLESKNNTRIQIDYKYSALNESLDIKGFVCVFCNVTERVDAIKRGEKLEGQLRHVQKMDALGNLAGGIAHDFNNILAIVIGSAELGLAEGITDKARHYFNVILQSSERGADLVRQILTFSRMETAKYIECDPKAIMSSAIKLARASIPMNIKINQDFCHQDVVIVADSTQIHQVIINLMTNAYHAVSDTTGQIDIKLELVNNLNISCGSNASNYIKITVTDNGCGIEEKNKDRIFDPFFTTKNVGEGTGIGLAVVYGIVNQHQGSIIVESDVGKGSSFIILFPTTNTMIKDQVTIGQKIINSGKAHILLVEDEKLLGDTYLKYLENLGYTITYVSDGLQALTLYQATPNKFDILVTDQAMPNMTGKELATKVLALNSHFPIILLTGYSSTISEEDANQLGIKKYLMKPVSLKALANNIETCLH